MNETPSQARSEYVASWSSGAVSGPKKGGTLGIGHSTGPCGRPGNGIHAGSALLPADLAGRRPEPDAIGAPLSCLGDARRSARGGSSALPARRSPQLPLFCAYWKLSPLLELHPLDLIRLDQLAPAVVGATGVQRPQPVQCAGLPPSGRGGGGLSASERAAPEVGPGAATA
jgi:hypothetical protein